MLPWAALLALPVVGLLLGLFAPATTFEFEFGQRESGAPRLLAGEFHDTRSTLWLVPADDLQGERTRLADVPHAPDWDIEAATAPNASVAAVLSLPPGSWEPATQAALDLITERGVRRVLTGLDLSGGVLWSDDGEHLLVRHGQSLLVLEAKSGAEAARWSPVGVGGVYAVAMRGSTVWATTIDAWGTSLVALSLVDGRAVVQKRTRISDHGSRDWALSPDGTLLAFGEQQGVELSVRVTALSDSSADSPLLLSSASGTAARMAVSDVSGGSGIPNSAAPVWRPDGGLHFGSWSGELDRAQGFTLPLSWDPSGRWLALRSFSGSGPGAPGGERAAVRGPEGALITAQDANLRLFGWWHE